MKLTSEFLKKKGQGYGGPGGGYFSNSPINRGKPANSDNQSIDKYLLELQATPETAGVTLTPTGEQGTQGHKAPWQVYHDYPLSRRKWKTYDPAQDPSVMNNPKRRHYGLPRPSEKITMVGKKLAERISALFKRAKGGMGFVVYDKQFHRTQPWTYARTIPEAIEKAQQLEMEKGTPGVERYCIMEGQAIEYESTRKKSDEKENDFTARHFGATAPTVEQEIPEDTRPGGTGDYDFSDPGTPAGDEEQRVMKQLGIQGGLTASFLRKRATHTPEYLALKKVLLYFRLAALGGSRFWGDVDCPFDPKFEVVVPEQGGWTAELDKKPIKQGQTPEELQAYLTNEAPRFDVERAVAHISDPATQEYWRKQLSNRVPPSGPINMKQYREQAARPKTSGAHKATKYLTAPEYGLRWAEFDRNDRIATKEKWFTSAELREGFANKIEAKDNFKEFVAWSDPPKVEEVKADDSNNAEAKAMKEMYELARAEEMTPETYMIQQLGWEKDQAAQMLQKFPEVKAGSKTAKPKCPYCGVSDYSLMPTDFETAKCNKCGKNWNHGIVEGVNDPKTGAALPPPPPAPPAHVQKAPAVRRPAPPKGSPSVQLPSDAPDIYLPHVEHPDRVQDELMKKQLEQEQKERYEQLTNMASKKAAGINRAEYAAGKMECCGSTSGFHKQDCPVYSKNVDKTLKSLYPAKFAAHPLRFAVPTADAGAVAAMLHQKGLSNFTVDSEDMPDVSYFEFKTPEERTAAFELVKANFQSQIRGGKGIWYGFSMPDLTGQPIKPTVYSSLQGEYRSLGLRRTGFLKKSCLVSDPS